MRLNSTKAKWPIWLLGAVILAASGLAAYFYYQSRTSAPTNSGKTEVTKPAEPGMVSVKSNNLFAGNIYWGRYINDWSQKSDLKQAYPFSKLNEFKRDSYDNWIAGLECPLAAGVHLTSAEEEATLTFNCSPDYLPEAAKWFNIVTLANNHTDNQGPEAFAETKQHLDKQKVQYFGHYDPRALEDLCDVISLNAVATLDDGKTKEVLLPVAMCGYHGVFRIPTEESLAVMERYSKLMPVVALPHTGVEYVPGPDQIKTTLYRSMIDHGADMVLGDHPHWIQSTEAYQGKPIFYSMGNFIFDQQFNAEVTRSAPVRVVFEAKGEPAELEAWTKLAKDCQTYHDSCLATAEQQGLKPLEYSFGYQIIPATNTNRLTRPADKAQIPSIMQRLNWDRTAAGLSGAHRAL